METRVMNYQNTINPIYTTSNTRSSKYKQQDSMKIIDVFSQNGFTIDLNKDISYVKSRKSTRAGFQKHLMIFNHESLKIDESNKIQLLATNSHDGSSCLVLNLGVYRAICANGLVVGDQFFEIRIPHRGNNFYNRVNDGIQEIIKQAPLVASKVNKFKSIQLNETVVLDFCKFVARERLVGIKEIQQVILNTVNRPKIYRIEDQKNDLYTVLNRLQETAIRGGIQYSYITEVKDKDDQVERKLRSGTTREVKSINEKLRLNKLIWDYAEKIAA